MRFSYAYKTSDGVRHEDSMEAKCREDVFAALRARGIKAIKVVAGDGSKANGEPARTARPSYWSWVFPSAIFVSLLVLSAGVWRWRISPDDSALESRVSCPRHQIYGDPAILARFERGDF